MTNKNNTQDRNICSTLILNQLRRIFEANDQLLGQAELNKENFNKMKLNARKTVFINFGKKITELLGIDKPHYDQKVLKAPSKLDLSLEDLQTFCMDNAYRVQAYENELEFFNNKSYRVNIIRSTHAAYSMIANKWLPSQIGSIAENKPLHLGALFSYTQEDLHIVELKEALIELSEQEAHNPAAKDAIDQVGHILHEDHMIPTWSRIFKSEVDLPADQYSIRSEKLTMMIFGKIVFNHVYMVENVDSLDSKDMIYLDTRKNYLDYICREIIPSLKKNVSHDIYNKPGQSASASKGSVSSKT
jgi:hypothetical protein